MMNGKPRTLAFQISEEFFQRIKAHLERETARTGHKLTQREFVLGLIEESLNEAERQAQEEAAPQTEAQQEGMVPAEGDGIPEVGQDEALLTGDAEDTAITPDGDEKEPEYPGADFND